MKKYLVLANKQTEVGNRLRKPASSRRWHLGHIDSAPDSAPGFVSVGTFLPLAIVAATSIDVVGACMYRHQINALSMLSS